MNKQAVRDHIKYMREDKYSLEFYTALLLYDVAGLDEKEVTDEQIEKAYDLQDEYESVYNPYLRDEVKEQILGYDKENEEDYEEDIFL